MSKIIGFLAGLSTAYLIFFKFGAIVVANIMVEMNPPLEWFGTIQVVVWTVLIALTFTFVTGVSSLVGMIVSSIIERI